MMSVRSRTWSSDLPQSINRRTPVLTTANRCIWHGCGANLGRRQLATMMGGAGRPGARMPRCTPTGLNHVVGCRQPGARYLCRAGNGRLC